MAGKQADGMGVGAIYVASNGHYKIEGYSVNSIRLVNIESWSHGSPIPTDSSIGIAIAFRCNGNGTDLAPIR